MNSLEFVSLLGNGSAASVSLSPQSIDFGQVLVGRNTSQSATLTNTGSAPVTINGIATSGGDFTITSSSTLANQCPSSGNTLAAGASCSIPVVFTPSATGAIRGTLSVATSATSLPLSVALSGVGTQPQLAITPRSLAFGDVTIGSQSTLSLTLHNSSTLPVDGLTFTVTRDFAVSSTCGITTLNAGSSCAVSVTYTPTSVGAINGTLTLASSDPASPITGPLTGTGIGVQIQNGSFTLTVNGGLRASASVQQGIAAAYSLNVTPTNGYSGIVALTCTPDDAVMYAACSLLPSTVTLTTGSQASTATITTVTAVPLTQLRLESRSKGIVACLLPAGFLLVFIKRRKLASTMLLCLVVFSLNGCGSGGDPRIRYVGPGTYTFHVTATSTSGIAVSQTVALTLVVTPKS